MSYLASDDLEGREAGTRGYDRAADYVAAEFANASLEPAGIRGSYFQTVNLSRTVRDTEAGWLHGLTNDGIELQLTRDIDYAVFASPDRAESSVTASVVFVGHGFFAIDHNRDDFGHFDVKGKIVALIGQTPPGFSGEERAFYASQRAQVASERGAIGMLWLPTIGSENSYSFERMVRDRALDRPAMSWIEPDGMSFNIAPNLQVSAMISMRGAEKLFEKAPYSWFEITAQVEAGANDLPIFELPLSITMRQRSSVDRRESANVLGLLRGSDSALKNEVVIVSAHLDHLGIAENDKEDRIYNGALDNASGVAILIETVRILRTAPRLRRSILFITTTAEEKGKLGAQYFVKHPTIPLDKLVANINLDQPLLTYEFTDVVAFGGERSSIGMTIKRVAERMRISVAPDPNPAQGVFTRGDHFRFAEAGIPSVMLATGNANGGEQAWKDHFAKHYHRPSDDMKNDLSFTAAAKFTQLNASIVHALANDRRRPTWTEGDFFERQFSDVAKSNR